jgi:hypothetical protein
MAVVLAIGCGLLAAIGYLLLTIGYWLSTIDHWLLATFPRFLSTKNKNPPEESRGSKYIK